MNSVIIQKSKLAKTAFILSIISYPILFSIKLFDFLGFNAFYTSAVFLTPLILGIGLGILSFVMSIIALVFIKKNNLLGKKIAVISLVASILLPILFYSTFLVQDYYYLKSLS